jgi:DNA-binding response OmpR family regulator
MSLPATLPRPDQAPATKAAPDVAKPPGIRVHEGQEQVAKGHKKVLLLEDDPAFKEIMTDFLTESGYTVVAVQNGVEGVHEVLASDFEVILCDMMMPTLPGDMFYRAVERMRPHLCERFIFMTGHRGNHKVIDFVMSVNGAVLGKPFHVDDLLEMIAFTQVRTLLLAA